MDNYGRTGYNMTWAYAIVADTLRQNRRGVFSSGGVHDIAADRYFIIAIIKEVKQTAMTASHRNTSSIRSSSNCFEYNW